MTSKTIRIRPTMIFALIATALLSALTVVVTAERDDETVSVCGTGPNPNGYVIDLAEPDLPGPFHDLTKSELVTLREYLKNNPRIRASNQENAKVNSSYIYMMDLYLPKKRSTLQFLDSNGQKPEREARVIMFRGDLNPAKVEEYICGPLPRVNYCNLLETTSRRNPIEFAVRSLNDLEIGVIVETILPKVDKHIGYILKESFNATFTNCDLEHCLSFSPSPVGTGILGDINKRRIWLYAQYNIHKIFLYTLDFGILVQLDQPDPSTWSVAGVWYNSKFFNTMDDLVYDYDLCRVGKMNVTQPPPEDRMFSSLKQQGAPQPPKSQRPPTLVEPDGKRYSVNGRKVEYMGWSFNYRLSALNGPFVYDVRFQGERIAYEVGLSEIAVFYSGFAPFTQTMDYVDSAYLLGIHSKSLLPGGDCPETATFIKQTFFNQFGSEPSEYPNAMCLFEQNNGYPLRRHSAYSGLSGGFYGGMLDSALTLRAGLTIGNYDYIMDFIWHQNGVMETRFMSTGYIMSSFYTEQNAKYGFKLYETVLGNIHHHVAHFKVDLDVGGTSNRYERLNIAREKVRLSAHPGKNYFQNTFTRELMKTEMDALYKYSFTVPKYHIVHNNAKKTKLDQLKGYKIQIDGMSNWLHPENSGNEATVSWARHQMVVTKQKDEEFVSTSNYGMFDSLDPVVKFNTFYEDNENIVDEDLVFWITCGIHHIPRAEDLPVVTTVENQLSFFLIPFNYFEGCPSMGSRDAIYVKYKDENRPEEGVTLTRYLNSSTQCITPDIDLDTQLANDPSIVLESP